MTGAPNLLNDDGSASMATMMMMSHHGFRRDLARFRGALQKMAQGEVANAALVKEEWTAFRSKLHGHHQMEDTQIFPHLRRAHASLAATIDRLTADHRRIDPLLDRGDRVFPELPRTQAAAAVVAELMALLDPHLATEEEAVIPFLREAKEFPSPAGDAEAALYAEGFAWSSHGVAPDVLEKVFAMLPASLSSRLPAARAAFDAHCARLWGAANTGTSRTPIPDR
jgi:hemerythrin-like domain-containing protein